MANKGPITTKPKTKRQSSAKKQLDAILKYAPNLEEILKKVKEDGLSKKDEKVFQDAIKTYEKYNDSRAKVAVSICKSVLDASKESEKDNSNDKSRSVDKILASKTKPNKKQIEPDHELLRDFMTPKDEEKPCKLTVYTKSAIKTIGAISDCITVGRALVAAFTLLGPFAVFKGAEGKTPQRADAPTQITNVVYRQPTAAEYEKYHLAKVPNPFIYDSKAGVFPTTKELAKGLERAGADRSNSKDSKSVSIALTKGSNEMS